MGGAIRARETRRLFHAAASKLCDWQEHIRPCNKARAPPCLAGMLMLRAPLTSMQCLTRGLSCAVQVFATGAIRVWNELYAADTGLSAFLPRKDERWERVALSVRKPRLDDLKLLFRTVGQGSVVHYDGSPVPAPLPKPSGDARSSAGTL